MTRIAGIILLILFFFNSTSAQEKVDKKIVKLYDKYKSEQYEYIIENAPVLRENYKPKDLNNQYLSFLTGLAYINMNKKYNANIEFLDLLEMNPDFTCDIFDIKMNDMQYFNDFRNDNLGSVHITSVPANLDVYINDSPKGKTPLKIENLLSGSYTVKILYPGYNVYEEEIYIESMDTLVINAHLGQERIKKDFTIISVPPEAEVYMNGEYLGKTPLKLTGMLTGLYRIKLRKDDFYDKEVDYILSETSEEFYNIVLEKKRDYFLHTAILPGYGHYKKGHKLHGLFWGSAFLAWGTHYFRSKKEEDKIYQPVALLNHIIEVGEHHYYLGGTEINEEKFYEESEKRAEALRELETHKDKMIKIKNFGYLLYILNFADYLLLEDNRKKYHTGITIKDTLVLLNVSINF